MFNIITHDYTVDVKAHMCVCVCCCCHVLVNVVNEYVVALVILVFDSIDARHTACIISVHEILY